MRGRLPRKKFKKPRTRRRARKYASPRATIKQNDTFDTILEMVGVLIKQQQNMPLNKWLRRKTGNLYYKLFQNMFFKRDTLEFVKSVIPTTFERISPEQFIVGLDLWDDQLKMIYISFIYFHYKALLEKERLNSKPSLVFKPFQKHHLQYRLVLQKIRALHEFCSNMEKRMDLIGRQFGQICPEFR